MRANPLIQIAITVFVALSGRAQAAENGPLRVSFKQNFYKYLYHSAPNCEAEVFRSVSDCSSGQCIVKEVLVEKRQYRLEAGSPCDNAGTWFNIKPHYNAIVRKLPPGKTTARKFEKPNDDEKTCAQKQEDIANQVLLGDEFGSTLGRHLKIDTVQVDLYSNQHHGYSLGDENRIVFGAKVVGKTLRVQAVQPALNDCKPTSARQIAAALLESSDGFSFTRRDPKTGTDVNLRVDKGRFVKDVPVETTEAAHEETQAGGTH